jgi:Family of unknown function (DUF6264)
MSDERPRPQYGEYATPEQQAHAMGKRPIPPLRHLPEMPPPPDPAKRVVDPTQVPGSTQLPDSTQRAPDPTNRVLDPTQGIGSARRAAGHPVDRIFTIVLLGLGLFQLLDSIQGYLDFRVALNQLATEFGLSYAAPAAAAQAGYWSLASNVVLLVLTAVVAIRSVRRSRIAFYIPLIGYVLFEIVMVTIVMTIVPSFTHLMSTYLTSTQ